MQEVLGACGEGAVKVRAAAQRGARGTHAAEGCARDTRLWKVGATLLAGAPLTCRFTVEGGLKSGDTSAVDSQ